MALKAKNKALKADLAVIHSFVLQNYRINIILTVDNYFSK